MSVHDNKEVIETILHQNYLEDQARLVIKKVEKIRMTKKLKGMNKAQLIARSPEETVKAMYLDAIGINIDEFLPETKLEDHEEVLPTQTPENVRYIPENLIKQVQTQNFTLRDIKFKPTSDSDIRVFVKNQADVHKNEFDLTVKLSKCPNIPEVINSEKNGKTKNLPLIMKHRGIPLKDMIWPSSAGHSISFVQWLKNKQHAKRFKEDMMNALKCMYDNSIIHGDLGYVSSKKKSREYGYRRNILLDALDTKRFYVIDFGRVLQSPQDLSEEEFKEWTPERQFKALYKLVTTDPVLK